MQYVLLARAASWSRPTLDRYMIAHHSVIAPLLEKAVMSIASSFISPASPQDYDTAKLLKEAETQLKSLGQQLAQLEVAKRQAVEDEDYDRAKMLKVRKATTFQALTTRTRKPSVTRSYVLFHAQNALHKCWPLFSVQVEADSLRLQIATHPSPELRAKLEEAGVQVSTVRRDMRFEMFRFPALLLPSFHRGRLSQAYTKKLESNKLVAHNLTSRRFSCLSVHAPSFSCRRACRGSSKPQLDWCEVPLSHEDSTWCSFFVCGTKIYLQELDGEGNNVPGDNAGSGGDDATSAGKCGACKYSC